MTQQPSHRGPFGFERPFYWSLQKLEILEKYAQAAAPILARNHRVTFVDLMAGEARYESGELGSTGHFARIASANAAVGRSIRCIAYETNPAAFAKLEANTADVRQLVDVRNARWEEDVPALLRDIQGDFAFFFVDPMGLREISWSALDPLLTRPSSEILVNFASPIAARLVGKWRRGAPTATGDKNRLDAVFGGESWVSVVSPYQTTSGELLQSLAQHYADRVAAVGQYGVASQTIRQGGASGKPKYHLIFGSRNELAFVLLSGIIAGQTERLKIEALQASTRIPEGQIAMVLDVESPEQVAGRLLVEELANSLVHDPELLGRPMTLTQLYREAIDSRFGEYRRALYRAAVFDKLDPEGRVIIHDRKRSQWGSVIEIPRR